MAINTEAYRELITQLEKTHTTLVAVSKTKPPEDIRQLYELGQRDFGENYVQELVDKQSQLPPDIRWHFIGHLQSNKVKYIAAFVHLIHGVDSLKLLQEINKQAAKTGRVIDILIQVHIAEEETKFGMDQSELETAMSEIMSNKERYSSVRVRGLMGMASFSEDMNKVRNEFQLLKSLFDQWKERAGFSILSMGMSADYQLAVEEGSTLIRVGSLLFGERARPA